MCFAIKFMVGREGGRELTQLVGIHALVRFGLVSVVVVDIVEDRSVQNEL